MAKHKQQNQPLEDIRIGDVTFYNGTLSTHYGREFVTFYVGSDAVLREQGGIIENCSRTVTLDKASWDSMVAALQALNKREAA